MPRPPIFYFALAYDHLSHGRGSKARCDALMEESVETGPLWRHIVLTGGKDPRRPELPSLADQMAEYITKGYPVRNLHVVPSQGWGSLAEIETAFRTMRELCPDEATTVYVSTNRGHMPRTLVYMNALKPKGWAIRPIYADHSFCWKDRLMKEPFKVLIALAKYPALRMARATP